MARRRRIAPVVGKSVRGFPSRRVDLRLFVGGDSDGIYAVAVRVPQIRLESAALMRNTGNWEIGKFEIGRFIPEFPIRNLKIQIRMARGRVLNFKFRIGNSVSSDF